MYTLFVPHKFLLQSIFQIQNLRIEKQVFNSYNSNSDYVIWCQFRSSQDSQKSTNLSLGCKKFSIHSLSFKRKYAKKQNHAQCFTNDYEVFSSTFKLKFNEIHISNQSIATIFSSPCGIDYNLPLFMFHFQSNSHYDKTR